MAFIENYKNFQLWESDRHGKDVKGTKLTSSIQIRDYRVREGYLLVKQISFKLGNWENRLKAILKAKRLIDEGSIKTLKL